MRISFIHDVAMPHSAANTVNVAKMCAAFAGLGHNVTLFCAGIPGSGHGLAEKMTRYYALGAPFRVRPIPDLTLPGGVGSFTLAATLGAVFARPDLVYARKPALLKWAAKIGLPVVLETHISLAEMGPRNRAAFASLLTSGQLRRIVTISAALRDEFLRRHGELSPLLAVAHDGADVAPAMDRTPAVRPNPGRMQVGYAGHLYDGKGVELIAELVRRCPWADFLIVGGAPDIVERWRGRLAGHANVRFCGQVPHAEVPDYLAGCQVVLAPYAKRVLISDGRTDVSRWMSPLKIFEYMALGKAILCSDLPVLREILEDGHTALLCPPEAPEYWASALQRLAGNPALICSLAAAALATFESRHTWRKRAGAILTDVIS